MMCVPVHKNVSSISSTNNSYSTPLRGEPSFMQPKLNILIAPCLKNICPLVFRTDVSISSSLKLWFQSPNGFITQLSTTGMLVTVKYFKCRMSNSSIIVLFTSRHDYVGFQLFDFKIYMLLRQSFGIFNSQWQEMARTKERARVLKDLDYVDPNDTIVCKLILAK